MKKIICLLCLALFSGTAAAATRHYYIAAENVVWDYAPSGMDLTHGGPIPLPWVTQTSWNKSRFIEYTDATFSVRKPQPEWLGILGPVIRGEVGDEIIVEFLNRTHAEHSIHPHGLRYDKANEGAHYVPSGRGGEVPPGGRFTYHWFADEGSGPGKNDPSSLVWWYHPHTDAPVEINAGLLGPIVITAKGKARPDGSPKDVDREFVTMFMIFDELKGKDAGLFHSINGYIFGNLPGLLMKRGERVRWYLLGMGNEKDLHTPHWHGKTVDYVGRHTDVVELLPATMAVADMVADNPGSWMYHCHVSDHMEAGMMAIYTIYEPLPVCQAPVKFVSADFWKTPGKFRVTVRNTSSKTITKLTASYDHLMPPLYRRRPFADEWTWDKPIPPGQEETFEMPGYLPGLEQKILGWVLFPRLVQYADGTTWQAPVQDKAEACFDVFWRDAQHPPLPVLPPVQVEMTDD
ncbi:MAG: multicopper oxidase domain-containing protein [Acidobacteria bacterium]|nr:multicopper oxidase domain-containing protein [Acidobacteriota bacterium]